MILRPFFRYYGAKARIAHHYPRPQYQRINEAFAGTAGYSLLYPRKEIVLYDIYPIVVEIWKYLIHATEREIMTLPVDLIDVKIADLKIPQEAKWLLGMWVSLTPQHPSKKMSKWTKQYYESGRHNREKGRLWGHRVRGRIASQLRYIRHWKVYNKPYHEIPDRHCTWFIDPPYNNKAGEAYVHGSKDIDYVHLGTWCQERKGQVIVCENTGADWLPFRPITRVKAAPNRRTGEDASLYSGEVMYYRSDRKSGFGFIAEDV